MNAKIKKLIKQATTIRYSGPGEIEEFDREKFAQLLIEECARQVKDDDNAFDILKHFGVEE